MAEADLELKYAHLGHRATPKRKANRDHLREMIADWQAEQEQKNVALQRGRPTPRDLRWLLATRRGSRDAGSRDGSACHPCV